jgi:hypothetical protein
MEPQIVTVIVAVVTAVVGPILVYYVTNRKNTLIRNEWKRYKKFEEDSDSYLRINYGIKITFPKGDTLNGDLIDVTGVYSVMPPPETLRLYTFDPNRTKRGERFWPQDVIREFSPETKTWRGRVHIGGLPKGGGIIAAVVSQPAIVLWELYYKVGPKIGWWDIEGWPNDSIVCDRVNVTKV